MSEHGRFWFRASSKSEAHTLATRFAIEQHALIRAGDLSVHPATMGGGWWGMVSVAVTKAVVLEQIALCAHLMAFEHGEPARGIARDYLISADREPATRRRALELASKLNAAQVLTGFLLWPGANGWTAMVTITASDHEAIRALAELGEADDAQELLTYTNSLATK